MNHDFTVIDGCAFTEGAFIGLSETVKNSPLNAFFLTTPGEDAGLEDCATRIGRIYNLADDPQTGIRVVRSVDDLKQAKADNKIGLILAFQNPYSIQNSIDKLRAFYELGIRVIQMTYNKLNYIGAGCTEPNDYGLSDFGRSMLAEMNRIGIVADISHCGYQTSYDVLKYSEKPVVFSHAGAMAVTRNPRNKSDDLLLMLKENNGVIGLSPWGPLCWKPDEKRRPTLSDYVDHIDHVVNLIGIDHVGFGGDSTLDDTKDEQGTVTQATLYAAVVADYDKYVGTHPSVRHAVDVDGVWQIENVFGEMRKRGYREEDIGKFAGGNFLRVLEANWK